MVVSNPKITCPRESPTSNISMPAKSRSLAIVASYAVNITIRSPRPFIRARSGTRTFLGIPVIGPSSTFLEVPPPWSPASHAMKPFGLPVLRLSNTSASPDQEDFADPLDGPGLWRCLLSRWGPSKPRPVPNRESFRQMFSPAELRPSAPSSALLPQQPGSQPPHRYEPLCCGLIRRLRPPISATIDDAHRSASGFPSMPKLDPTTLATPCSAEAKDWIGCNAPQLTPWLSGTANA